MNKEWTGNSYWSEQNIGRKVNFLTIIGMKKHGGKRNRKVYICRCCCNKEIEIEPYRLFGSHPIQSCGCKTNEIIRSKNQIHGLKNSRIYRIWHKIKQRCHKENDKLYEYYGGRGISICEEWDENFMSFYHWSMNNGYSDVLTIDRIDVNGNYEPLNCRWVPMKVQCNNKRNNIVITYKSKTQTLKQWCEELNIDYKLVYGRITYRGWSIERAFETPNNGWDSDQIFTYKGKTQNLSQWCREHNMPEKVVSRRIKEFHWDFQRAISTPCRKIKRRNTDE